MTTARLILALVMLLFGAYIVVMNWWCMIISSRNQRQGIDRHHSMIYLFSLVLAGLALLIYPGSKTAWWMLGVPLMDIANWALLWLPIGLIQQRRKEKSRDE